MAKQVVKNYVFYPGDFRGGIKAVDIVSQINQDLKKNPSWSIKILTYIDGGESCTVVFDIDGSERVLVENKTNTVVGKVTDESVPGAEASGDINHAELF